MTAKKRKRKTNIKKSKKSAGGKKYFFGTGSKWLFRLAAFFVILYLVLGAVVSPELLQRDLKDKYGKVAGAVSVSALVRGLPKKPVVMASSGCDGAYPYIDLDWADDLGVDTFDVYRDGALLVAGLAASSYRDNNASNAAVYSYSVAAHGPAGDNQSDTVTAQATECYTPPPPPPPVDISSLVISGIDVTNFQCCPKINKKNPVFSGTTNVAGARVAVGIQSGKRSVISTFSANQNGCWSWKSRTKLSKGLKTFYLTIIDPNDASRVASTSFQFKIAKRKMSEKTLTKCMGGAILDDIIAEIHPFFVDRLFSLAVKNQNRVIHSGETLGFSLLRFPGGYSPPDGASYQLEIIDQRGNSVYKEERKPNERGKGEDLGINEKISPGEYKLIAKYSGENLDIGAEDNFEVKEKPLLVLGSGYEITYRQILSNLGWAALFSLGLMGIFLFLLFFEYHLVKRGFFEVSGSDLKERGMID